MRLRTTPSSTSESSFAALRRSPRTFSGGLKVAAGRFRGSGGGRRPRPGLGLDEPGFTEGDFLLMEAERVAVAAYSDSRAQARRIPVTIHSFRE